MLVLSLPSSLVLLLVLSLPSSHWSFVCSNVCTMGTHVCVYKHLCVHVAKRMKIILWLILCWKLCLLKNTVDLPIWHWQETSGLQNGGGSLSLGIFILLLKNLKVKDIQTGNRPLSSTLKAWVGGVSSEGTGHRTAHILPKYFVHFQHWCLVLTSVHLTQSFC